jgi:hypothetical protein
MAAGLAVGIAIIATGAEDIGAIELIARIDQTIEIEQARSAGLFFRGVWVRLHPSKPAEALMTKWIGAAILALGLIGCGAAMDPVAAASQETMTAKPGMRDTAGAHGRRHARHHEYARYRSAYQPTYLDRPYYYAPAPNFALAFGFGFGPWW